MHDIYLVYAQPPPPLFFLTVALLSTMSAVNRLQNSERIGRIIWVIMFTLLLYSSSGVKPYGVACCLLYGLVCVVYDLVQQ